MQRYELDLESLDLKLKTGDPLSMTEALASGRANYIIFENLVRKITGLDEGKGCDHQDENGRRYEQKAFSDVDLYPSSKDTFQVSPSSTFPANNNGPEIQRLLDAGKYLDALEVCKTVKNGYNSNDFYVLTNTANFRPTVPFRYFIVESKELLRHLSKADPREVSKESLFAVLKPKIIRLTWVGGVFKVLKPSPLV
jgi:hypothetical protein